MDNTNRLTLLSGVTTNTTGTPVQWSGQGSGTLQILGTFDGATVTIQGSLDGVNWNTPLGGAYTAATITPFEMGLGDVRAVVSGAGASTDLTAYLQQQESR